MVLLARNASGATFFAAPGPPESSEFALDHVGVLNPASAITIDEAGSDEYLVGAVRVLIEDARRHDELLEVLQASVRCPNEAVDVLVDSGVIAVESPGCSRPR